MVTTKIKTMKKKDSGKLKKMKIFDQIQMTQGIDERKENKSFVCLFE